MPLSQREQGENAAFALVVGAHHEADVFQRNHQHKRPEHQGKNPQNIVLREGQVVSAEYLLQGVKRACADVAKDNAERTERKRAGSPMCSV
jgi:hypothetical protein